MTSPTDSPSPIDNHPDDVCWSCCRCDKLIAILDTGAEELRLHDASRKVFLWTPATKATKATCRRCGYINVLGDLLALYD